MRCQCVCVEWSELQFDTPVAVSSATGPGTFTLVTWSNLHHSFDSNCFCLFLNERETWQRRIRQKMEETGQMRCVFIVNVSYWKQTNNNRKAAEKKRRKEEKKEEKKLVGDEGGRWSKREAASVCVYINWSQGNLRCHRTLSSHQMSPLWRNQRWKHGAEITCYISIYWFYFSQHPASLSKMSRLDTMLNVDSVVWKQIKSANDVKVVGVVGVAFCFVTLNSVWSWWRPSFRSSTSSLLQQHWWKTSIVTLAAVFFSPS